MAVLTIEELLARKEQQAQKGKPACKSVFIPGLGGEVEVVPMAPSKFLEYSFQLGNSNGDGAAMLDAQCAMIYACCPLFHDRQLQDAYGCQEPHEVIAKGVWIRFGRYECADEASLLFTVPQRKK